MSAAPEPGRPIIGDELAVPGTLLTLRARPGRREALRGKAWLAASTSRSVCFAVQLITERGAAASWTWRVGRQELPSRAQSNTSTGQGFWYSLVSCAPREAVLVDGRVQASLAFHGRTVATPAWEAPASVSLVRDDAELQRRLDHQVLLSVRRPVVPPTPQPSQAEDDVSVRHVRSPELRDIRLPDGGFVAGSLRRRGDCGLGESVDEACYRRTHAQDDARLCGQVSDRARCLSEVRRHTTEWYASSSGRRFVVVLVTGQGVIASSPNLNGMLGDIDTKEEARIQAAMVTGVWDDAPVLDLGDGRFFVYTTPFVHTNGGTIYSGVSAGCRPPRDPSWADPSLSCTVVLHSSSCNSVPGISFECQARPSSRD